jgi:hypothetical protein
MKTYNIMLSVVFPVTHPRKGQPTGFKDKVPRAVCKTGERYLSDIRPKVHTIRANYPLRKKRIEDVEERAGKLCAFFKSPIFEKLSDKKKELMHEQYDAMILYSTKVGQRLELEKKGE